MRFVIVEGAFSRGMSSLRSATLSLIMDDPVQQRCDGVGGTQGDAEGLF